MLLKIPDFLVFWPKLYKSEAYIYYCFRKYRARSCPFPKLYILYTNINCNFGIKNGTWANVCSTFSKEKYM